MFRVTQPPRCLERWPRFMRVFPSAHIEAGLRTGDLAQPFPEEMNRVLTGRLAALHFAATEGARRESAG